MGGLYVTRLEPVCLSKQDPESIRLSGNDALFSMYFCMYFLLIVSPDEVFYVTLNIVASV